jgi:2-dehydro-3-deoxyphosphooctonate aldolase (KDO 8-P synthase)
MVPVLARAAAGVGVSGFFMETHPNPEKALSDGANMIPIHKMADMLKTLQDIDNITKQNGFLEDEL